MGTSSRYTPSEPTKRDRVASWNVRYDFKAQRCSNLAIKPGSEWVHHSV